MGLAAPPDFSAYDLLDVPIMAIVRRRIVYANEAFVRLIGAPRTKMVGYEIGSERHSRVLLSGPQESITSSQLLDALEEGRPLPRDLWVELAALGGPIRTSVRVTAAPGEQSWVITVLDAPGVAEARRLSEAMIQFAPELLRSRTERQVLEGAVRLLAESGLQCSFMFLRGAQLLHGPMFQGDAPVAVVERMYGRPLTEVTIPLGVLPYLEQSLLTRRATFHQDVFEVVSRIHPPEVVAYMRECMPSVPMLDAPIFVGDIAYGVLGVMGASLTPATAVPVEMFCQLVGSAIEGALHTQEAENRMTELKQLQLELLERERLATLGQAGAVVAHEVRNPLGAIINAVAVLNRDKALKGDSAQVVQVIEEEAMRLDRMVGDLLAFARPLEPRPTPCDLQEVAQRVINELNGERSDVTLSLLPSSEGAAVRADPDLLLMALGNLIRNGVQASPRGGEVRVEVFSQQGLAGVSVHDEGPGITEPEAEKIFEPFFTTRATGTGLGLSVVHRVAAAHAGKVRVSKSRYGGAEFILELPVERR